VAPNVREAFGGKLFDKGVQRVQERSSSKLLRFELRPLALKASDTRRQIAHEVDNRILTYDGELLFKADEMNRVAVGFDPFGASMRLPALPTRSLISETDIIREQILDWTLHGGCIA
jgi:hypothetical protein